MHVNFLSYRLPARRHRCVTTLATTHASSWTATATTAATPRSTLSAPWAQVRWLGLRLGLGLDLLVRLPPGHTGAQRVSALSQRRLPPQTLLLLPPHSTMQCHYSPLSQRPHPLPPSHPPSSTDCTDCGPRGYPKPPPPTPPSTPQCALFMDMVLAYLSRSCLV